ncbi:hypothetical protein AWH69_15035 [Janibacter melonis]|uniref:ATP synthase protein I n=1 Tax=Janibacter melonis TaxID=262209 RepID=A0A176Q966_9MICO|nr:hypothetical protein [Janibacter melonis]OAB86209.1 hypothetical protein AWH69_15035 [Janibacter melonis]
MTPTRTTRGPISGMLRGVVIAGVAGCVAAPVIGWLAAGERAGWSALAGAAAASVIMVVGLLAMRLIMTGDPGTTMAGALVVYIAQLVILVAVLLAVRDQEWLHGAAFAASTVAQTVVLQVAQITGYARARHEIYPGGAR